METTPPDDVAIELFWAEARKVVGLTRLDVIVGTSDTASLTPPAWSFGETAEQADELVGLVLAGDRTATSSALGEWEAEDEDLPRPGDLAIVCDGAGLPRALVRTDVVTVVPFDEVDAEHARAEGAASLDSWRREHRDHLTAAVAPRQFAPDMPVVLERFTVLHPRPPRP
ncbi:ASCH domain-containing protein [Georgenia sp. M64]|uniref:ASCH domain-containing protein n=1 Tax=Georgenia sp. M64 TaxID=3120520 RepID=UPI0030E3597F